MNILIKNGRIIDPGRGFDRVGDLLITDGKTSWVGGEIAPPQSGYDIINAWGMVICPGFVDLHCHLRQPGFEHKETIATGTKAAARGGFTTVCCMPNTDPPLDNKSTVDYVRAVVESEGVIRVLPIGCVTKGRKGQELADFAELAAAGVVAFSDDGAPVSNARLMRQALAHSKESGLPVIDHCEDLALTEGGQVNEGEVSTKLGLHDMPAVAEEVMVARDLVLARATGGHLHIAHVSTAGAVGLIRLARRNDVPVTAEVTPHHLTLTESKVLGYDANAKVNPPLRTKEDTQALLRGLKENMIDAIATDHAPHSEADKTGDFRKAAFGISGLETALGSLLSLVHSGQVELTTLIAKLTSGPAKILGDKYSKLGSLAIGAPADVTIFDPNLNWVVDPRSFVSKGKNTPLAGALLKGKVMATLYQGKIVYRDDSVRVKKET
ncbi:MAG: dihydroorotase [Chloroflexi bacterium]|nr:dihydroorotase [Chloroflexota bacterium]